jgi:membrane protein implicated in regulation of membrane protease activity
MSHIALILTAACFLLIIVFLVILGLRAQKGPCMTGYEGMVGECGIIRKPRGFRGRQVMEIRGELWWCRSGVPLPPGTEAKVVDYDPEDPVLIVEPC